VSHSITKKLFSSRIGFRGAFAASVSLTIKSIIKVKESFEARRREEIQKRNFFFFFLSPLLAFEASKPTD
jgi:hypothetical protein